MKDSTRRSNEGFVACHSSGVHMLCKRRWSRSAEKWPFLPHSPRTRRSKKRASTSSSLWHAHTEVSIVVFGQHTLHTVVWRDDAQWQKCCWRHLVLIVLVFVFVFLSVIRFPFGLVLGIGLDLCACFSFQFHFLVPFCDSPEQNKH